LAPMLVLVAADVLRRWEETAATAPGSIRPWWSWLLAGQAVLLIVGIPAALVWGPVPWQEVDRAWLPAAWAGLGCVMVGFAVAGIQAWQRRLTPALVAIGLATVLGTACVLPRFDRLVPGFDRSRVAQPLSAPEACNDVVCLDEKLVHRYEFDAVFQRRAVLIGDARERGMGHLAEVLPAATPFPADTYRVSGENLPDNPWLWSRARLQQAWSGPQRVWVLCEDDLLARLRKRGLLVHEVARVRNVFLISNRP